MRFRSVIVALTVVGFSTTGCTAQAMPSASRVPTGEVLTATRVLDGQVTRVEVSDAASGGCGGDYLRVQVRQPGVNSAERFYGEATENVIRLVEGLRADPDYEGFGLDYTATMPGLVDRYGNESDANILWLCYSADDVTQINLDNRDYLRDNILDLNTLGQDDVVSAFR